MKKLICLKYVVALIFSLGLSVFVKANDKRVVCKLNKAFIYKATTDTLPAPTKPVETKTEKPATDKPVAKVIQKVPKARKVSVPTPVKVQPVKVVKPKIIKPVIKVL